MTDYPTDKYDRDSNSNALISRDYKGLIEYRSKKNQSRQLVKVTDDINTLKEELADIKSALKILIERK
jgi:hypothetical protein